ncbi:hypothetical protein B0H11DRAFT_2246096 [Mycena galericulata]|nr:hypothetical protein B0H11DRAFT_2258095 [Mycena galericulata]KAJ7452141.1 hypothetical protein B0H11DRAFT_2246096 [Mycena galericulata]
MLVPATSSLNAPASTVASRLRVNITPPWDCDIPLDPKPLPNASNPAPESALTSEPSLPLVSSGYSSASCWAPVISSYGKPQKLFSNTRLIPYSCNLHLVNCVLAPPNALRVVSIADLIGDLEVYAYCKDSQRGPPNVPERFSAIRRLAHRRHGRSDGRFRVICPIAQDLASTFLSASAPPNALHIVNIAALIGNLGALTSTFPTASAPPNATHVVATIV